MSSLVDELYTCESCDNYYCHKCSFTFTIHYQYEGSICYSCSDQNRKSERTLMEDIEHNRVEHRIKYRSLIIDSILE